MKLEIFRETATVTNVGSHDSARAGMGQSPTLLLLETVVLGLLQYIGLYVSRVSPTAGRSNGEGDDLTHSMDKILSYINL